MAAVNRAALTGQREAAPTSPRGDKLETLKGGNADQRRDGDHLEAVDAYRQLCRVIGAERHVVEAVAHRLCPTRERDLTTGVDDKVFHLGDGLVRVRLAGKGDLDPKGGGASQLHPATAEDVDLSDHRFSKERPLVCRVGVAFKTLEVDDFLNGVGPLEVEGSGADPEVPFFL